jgi:hypothetical protein
MMSEDHRLEVFDEEPVVGRAANASAWRGYMTAFPRYVIYPRRINADGDVVTILGHTTGSHFGLPDSEERELLLIWLAYVRDGAVERWCLIGDTPSNRKQFGFECLTLQSPELCGLVSRCSQRAARRQRGKFE